jgi:hypothetical protein
MRTEFIFLLVGFGFLVASIILSVMFRLKTEADVRTTEATEGRNSTDNATGLMRLKYAVLSNSIGLIALLVVGGIICLCVGWRPFDGTHHDSKDYANTELRSGVFVDWSVSVTTPAEAETLHPKQPNGGFRAPMQGTRLLHVANQDLLHVQRKNCSGDTIYFECWWENHKNGTLSYFPNGGRFAWLPGTDFPYEMILNGTTHLEGWVVRKDPSIAGSVMLQVRS